VVDLESEVKSLERQLQEEEEEASNVIKQWQESSSVLDEKCNELEKELEATTTEKRSLEKTLEKMQNEQEQCVAEKSSFESKISSLEEALKGEQASGNENLVAQLREKEEELRQAHHTIARDEKVVQQWEGK
jgi:chromosome segregation ATPase